MAVKSPSSLSASCLLEDGIVISGIAGHFPKSNSVMELQENLFNKVDLISDIPNQSNKCSKFAKRLGKINDTTKFDERFFGVGSPQAHYQMPMIRNLLERTYEAIIDAGINPVELQNTRTGVFVACSFTQSEEMLLYEKMQANYNGLIGCSEAMLAIRISNWLKVSGPACKIDTHCASSMCAFEQAYKFMRDETSDYAIVATVNVNYLNYTATFEHLGALSKDGRCKTFDDSADGFVRSEAIVATVLQKAKTARRIYAQVVHSKTKCDGFKEEGIFRTSAKEQERLLREFYAECKIDPRSVKLVECHGTGTPTGDPQELKALDIVMCSGRTKPLLLGSVKSNIGHTESAAALCSVVKICIAYNTGYIAPNINFWKCRQDVPALVEGRMRVVTEKSEWNRGLVGITSFGFGGSSAHTLLRSAAKSKKNNGLPQDDLPRLICVSGRTYAAVARILDSLQAKPIDVEELRLWHTIHEYNIEGHGFRGYALLKSSSHTGVSLRKDIRHVSKAQRPVLYYYSSTELQLRGIDKNLMKIPIFAATIEKCHEILKPKKVDLLNILTNNCAGLDILKTSIGITAIQLALTSVLTAMGIVPDRIIGHGLGEIACGYADSCLTLDQAMLCAYYRGLAFAEVLTSPTEFALSRGYKQPGIMNALDFENVHNKIGEKEDGHCRDKTSRKEVKDEIVPLNIVGIAFKLLKRLKEIIPSPKSHSKIWTPTFASETSESVLASAEYYYKIFMEEVLSNGTNEAIPNDSSNIYIDISPDSNCKKYVRDNRKDSVFVELFPKHHNGHEIIFKALGELFQAGLNPRLANLYPEVQFPVSQGTSMLSHMVEWDHREEWFTDLLVMNNANSASIERTVLVSVEDEDYSYLTGHKLEGRNVYPATGYLVLVWETLALKMKKSYQDVSVVFENVSFERITLLPTTGRIEFIVTIHTVTGEFEVMENNTTIVTGCVHAQNTFEEFNGIIETSFKEHDEIIQQLRCPDVYKLFSLRGYEYSGDFKGIMSCNFEVTNFHVSWNNNWVVFLDTFLQGVVLKLDTNSIMVPTRIGKVAIDVSAHYSSLGAVTDHKNIKACGDSHFNNIRSAGVEIRAVHFTSILKRPILSSPLLERYAFFPFEKNEITQVDDALQAKIQLILENIQDYSLKVVEIIDEEYKKRFEKPLIHHILDIQLVTDSELTLVTNDVIEMPSSIKVIKKLEEPINANLIIGASFCERQNVLEYYGRIIGDEDFVISREDIEFETEKFLDEYGWMVVSYVNIGTEYLVLLRKKKTLNIVRYVEIKMDTNFSWIDEVKEQMNMDKIFVVYSHDECSGILGFINSLKREYGGKYVRGFWINDASAPAFNPELKLYKQQLEKNLSINVLENNQWGSYSHLLLRELERPVPVDNAYSNIETIGDLSSIKWFEGALGVNKQIDSDSLLVNVYSAALNFRDVVKATGRVEINSSPGNLNSQYFQGLEFVGRTINGSRVMGMTEKAISNIVVAHRSLIMAIPNEWSFEEAATVFVTYFTAYASLVVYGNLKRGESVLIHAGSGGVGQAAINVALSYGCDIFTTVGSTEKMALVKKLFPQIKDSHIGCSRDTSFEEMIQQETKGKGVDVVLNSLAEDKLLATARCLGFRGRFVEIGLFDISKNTPIQMHFYEKEVSFHALVLENMHEDRHTKLRQRVLNLMANGISSGAVRPLTYCVFDYKDVIAAYTHMAAGKHIGKVVIKFRDEDSDRIKINNTPLKIEAVRRYTCNSNNVYVIVGGLGGIGIELAGWLILRGAKKLVLVSRKGITNGYQAYKIRKWKSYHIAVEISTHDVTKDFGCKEMLKLANSMGPVGAVFNLAMVLKDMQFENQTRETFEAVYAPKASVAFHLDKLTRILCPALKDFVMFSSYFCGRGNAGQTNYGLANSVMERLCEKRKKEGLPAVAIQWGAIDDVGYLMGEGAGKVKILQYQSITSCLSTLDKFLKQTDAVVSSYIPIETKIETDLRNGVDIITQLMGIKDIRTISYQMTLAELGMDSIVAVEIKQTLERNFGIFLSAKETRALTFKRLTELLTDKKATRVTEMKRSEAEVPMILRLFMKNFEDEISTNKPAILMNSNTNEKKNEDEKCFDSENIMFMVPGIEGCATSLETLCRQMKIKSCVLQLGLDHLDEDMPTMVDRLYKILRQHLNPNVPFQLLGYSYGTILVLEMAARLESEGLKGTVFCIDGSPSWCKTIIISNIPLNSPVDLQNCVIRYMMDCGNPEKNKEIMTEVEDELLFDDKIDQALKFLPNGINYRKEFTKRVIKAYYNRINALCDYVVGKHNKIKSRVVLIRTKVVDELAVSLSESYDLDKLADGNIDVHLIESDHLSIIEDKRCASVINNIL